MRFGISVQYQQKLARSAAIILVGGLAAGCSSQVDRFGESIFTGSSYPQTAAAQPYPGDQSYGNASLDQTYTGSVNDRAPRPDAMVGGGGMQSSVQSAQGAVSQLPPPSSAAHQPIASAPLPPVSSSGTTASALAPLPAEQQSSASSMRTSAAAPTKSTSIAVRPGDTVYSLSRRFDVPAQAIMAANGLSDASNLQAGQTVVIPAYAYSEKVPQASQPMRQAAKPAGQPVQREPERVATLPQASRLEDPDSAAVDADSRKADVPVKQAASGPTAGVYTVVSGDTLYGISRKTGVSVTELKAANGLSDGYLRVGQQLKLNGAAVPAREPVKVASASTQPVEQAKSAAAPEEQAEEPKVSAYTPPAKADRVVDEVKDEGQKMAALPPDSTGIGRLRWPVKGRIISSFGSAGPAGDGIDIAVPEGTPVKAAENGVVIYAGDGLKEFGKTVLVRHDDGLVTVYGYTGKIEVSRGDTVKRGQEIATSGMSGSADRPKLHFEVRKDAAPVDPMTFLD